MRVIFINWLGRWCIGCRRSFASDHRYNGRRVIMVGWREEAPTRHGHRISADWNGSESQPRQPQQGDQFLNDECLKIITKSSGEIYHNIKRVDKCTEWLIYNGMNTGTHQPVSRGDLQLYQTLPGPRPGEERLRLCQRYSKRLEGIIIVINYKSWFKFKSAIIIIQFKECW